MTQRRQRLPFYMRTHWRGGGHSPQIFLLGEAVSLMRNAVASAVVPVGWPPLAEILAETISLHIPIHV